MQGQLPGVAVAVNDKANEITALPALLQIRHVQGCVVTIDALGCQQYIAQTMRD